QSLKNARKRLSFGQAPVQLLALAGTLSFNAGDHFGARECLSEALRREPTNVQAREMLGRTYVALQRYADAVGEFSQVDPAAITKENIYAHYLFYGMSLLKIGRAADAEVQLRNALAIKPDSPDTLGMVYVSAHARGKAAEAAKIEARLVKMAQHDPRVYGTLAEAMDDSGAYQKAYQYFGKAYAALPSDALISRQLAASALRLKKYDEASSVSTAIIDAANVDTQILAYAYAIRGEVRWIRKENSDALADYEEAIKRNIPEWRAYSHAVSLIPHTDVANADKIEKYARIAIELNPKDEVAFNSLGASQYLKGRFADALANFKKAIELAPKFVHPHMNRSIIFWEQRKYGEAIAEVEKAIAKGLNTSDAHSKLGALYALTNRVNEASVQAKIAVQLDPKDHASRFLQFMTTIEKNNIAGNFADHGSTAYNKALEEAKGILKTWGAPGTMPAAYYDAQTIVALVSANYDTAAAYSRQSISINAANPAAYHRLAFALAQKRDFSAALAADRKALELAPNEPEIEKYASALEDILRSRQPIPPSSPPNGRRTVPQTTFILQDIGSFLKFPTYQNYLNLYRPLSPVYQMDVDRDRHGAEPFNGPRILNTTPIITIPML
ncbi:MAG: tetratricopeptide repeat protein, partial [bacterium]